MYLTGQASRFFFCFPLLPRVVPPLPPLSPALPSLKRPSCPVAQHACLTWYFTGWAPVRVRACIWGLASHTEFGWVSLSSSGPVLLSIIPPQQSQGQPLIPPCPISDSVGAPDSSHHRPNRPPPLECEFPDLRLQIVHLQQCQSRNTVSFGNAFPPQLMLSVLCPSLVSPGSSVFPSKWARETEIRGVLQYVWIHVWGCCREDPVETKCTLPTFNMWWSVGPDLHFSGSPAPYFPSFASLWCSMTINIPTLSWGLLKAWGLIQGSSKTCKLSIFHCKWGPPPPPRFFISPPPPILPDLVYRMARLFLYSPVALLTAREGQPGPLSKEPGILSHLPLVFRPPLHSSFKLSFSISPPPLPFNNPLPPSY